MRNKLIRILSVPTLLIGRFDLESLNYLLLFLYYDNHVALTTFFDILILSMMRMMIKSEFDCLWDKPDETVCLS